MAQNAAASIGFIGLGNMGNPMVARLADAGHSLVLYDLRPEALEVALAASDNLAAASGPEELGARCGIAITMLPGSDAVEQAVLGPDGGSGLASTMEPGGLVVDMSSSAPGATVALGRALAGLGLTLVDAPVSGGVPRARDGSLTIMAGGDGEAIDRLEPLLAAMGQVHRTGPLGSGHAMKALNNYVSAAGLLAVCEALIVAGRFGLDPRVANDVLKASTGRNNTTDRKVEAHMLNRTFDSGFALDLMVKDVGLAAGLAAELDLDAPWLRACRDLLTEAAQRLEPGADHTEAFAFLEQRLALHHLSSGRDESD